MDELPPLVKLAREAVWQSLLSTQDGAGETMAYVDAYARAAVLAERERCAKVCEDRAKFWDANVPEGDEHVYAYRQEEAAWCADAIRERS